MTPVKTIALTTWTFVGTVMSLLFNMLFFQGASILWFHGCSHHLQWFWHTPKIVCQYFHCFCIICHEVMGPDAMIFVFWMLPFKPTFSLYSFTCIKRLFSSFSLSAIRVVSSAYLRLLIFLPAILIPACAFSSPEFLMMYSAYKLNKHGDNLQPWRTPFLIWNQSVVPCPTLTVASWPAYRFLKRQVRWSGIPISFRIFHSLLWSTQRLRHSRRNRSRCFFWNSFAFSMIQQMLAIWSLVLLPFSKSSLNIWKFMVHALLKPGLENFEHYFASMWDECKCVVVWTFFGIVFLWNWNENWPFPVLWLLLKFLNLLAYWMQHFHSIIF